MKYRVWVGRHVALRMVYRVWTPELQDGLPPDKVRFALLSNIENCITSYEVCDRVAARERVKRVVYQPDFDALVAIFDECQACPVGSPKRPAVPPYCESST